MQPSRQASFTTCIERSSSAAPLCTRRLISSRVPKPKSLDSLNVIFPLASTTILENRPCASLLRLLTEGGRGKLWFSAS
jgi:hypothetical protein